MISAIVMIIRPFCRNQREDIQAKHEQNQLLDKISKELGELNSK